MRLRASFGAGLLLGVVTALWDGLATILENPHTFGRTSVAKFLAATSILHVALGALAGISLGNLLARCGMRSSAFIALGLGVWLFLWAGIRVHVRYLFGEPLTSPASVIAYGLVLAGAILFAEIARRLLRRAPLAWLESSVVGAAGGGLVLAAALLLSSSSAVVPESPARAPAPGARDLLLVTLDTTRADHLSCYGYPRGTTPSIDRLARGAATARSCYATIPLTNPSHCSLFTGMGAREHGVLNNGMALPDSIPTFVEQLARDGFRCAAFVSGIPLKKGLSGLARGFELYDDSFSVLEGIHPMLTALAVVRTANRVLPIDVLERRSKTTCARAAEWLRESSSPRFLWVHLFDPHTPYDAPPHWTERFRKESPDWSAHSRPVTGWPIADYDAELGAMDRSLAELLRSFEEVTGGKGILLVTADHGEGLEEHGELSHGSQLYAEDLHVPWILCDLASFKPSLDEEGFLCSTIEAHALLPARALSRTLVLEPAEALLAETFAPEGRENKSAVIGTLFSREAAPGLSRLGKIVVNWDRGEELAFRLDLDPGERRPVEARTAEWQELRSVLPEPVPSAGGSLDAEAERRLRALGYVH